MTSLVLKVHRDYQQLKLILIKMSTTNNNQLINQTVVTAMGAHILPSISHSSYDLKLQFNENGSATPDQQLKFEIEKKVKNKEFFYGIEILARNHHANTLLDYKAFGSIMPLFTSIVWLSSDYWAVENIEEVESIKLARKLQPHGIVLPHFSCYRLQEPRLKEFLNLNFSNVLAIRGDFFEPNQSYKYSEELVANIRKLKGDSITIGVGGYPEGHPECLSLEDDLNNLAKKVQAGADFIITQICFSPQAIIDFVKNCRSKAINVPILVGIFAPDNLRMLEAILRITKIKMPAAELEEYRQQNELGHINFRDYAVNKAVQMIEAIFASDADVYGLQFFTMNKFKNIPKVLSALEKNKNLIKKR
ncbi:methylenetetrahydrofolate reductase [Lucilia cuprina]|uniref:methylenetetrahydrofolate reductase n=1 Tax=Lucilia cuprina TaxID=7375 RepID=UPI001F06801F|nr:methylenetetrahydrofolate reductase [Lucilia cuprina]